MQGARVVENPQSERIDRPSVPRGTPPSAGYSPDELQRQLSHLTDELNRAQRLALLGTVTGLIAHEFNNLLTPVLSYAQLALAHPEDQELTRKTLERAARNSQHAARIAGSILALSRDARFGASGPDEPEVAVVSAAIREAIQSLGEDPSKRGITVQVAAEQALAVSMRPVALQQALLNLALNALRAMDQAGGRSLRFSAAESQHLPNHVDITVADDGPGISPDRASRLLTDERGEGSAGAGLGLLLCRRLVEDAMGRMAVESQVSVGTTVTITLPRASPPA